MMKKLLTLIKQNLVLSTRNSLVWVVLLSMVLIILVVKFAVPDQLSEGNSEFYLDMSENREIYTALTAVGVDANQFSENREDLNAQLEENSHSIGIIFEGSLESPRFQLIQTTEMNNEQLKLIQTSLSKMIGSINGTWNGNLEVSFIRPQTEPVPRNLTLVPVLMVFEVLILGFLLIAVFIFQEKGDKVIRAYRISPGGTHLYILSKLTAFLLIGLLYAFGIVAFTVGFDFNILNFVIITILGFLLYTLIGLIVALFFDDISGWFTVGIVILTINMAPGMSHQMPSFAPPFMKWIPSYHIIFGYDDILFNTGKNMWPVFGLMCALTLIAYVVCYFLVDRKLMKEVN